MGKILKLKGFQALLLVVIGGLVVLPSSTSPASAFQSRVVQAHAKTIHSRTCTPNYRRVRASRLFAASSTASEVRDQLGLYDRFDRWRFLQNMLDEDVGADDTQLVLYALLDGYLKFSARPAYKQGSDETGSPVLTAERRENIEAVLQLSSAQAIHSLLKEEEQAEKDSVEVVPSTEILDKLELLLPDPVEDEDAFKGLWDTVIELHGRESVKINERNATVQWQTRCLIARVLVQYDFLTYGLVDEPLV